MTVVLSIDQASNCAGVSLWEHDKLDTLIATTELKSNSPKDSLPIRLVTQREQLRIFLQKYGQYPPDYVVCESVKSKMVMVVIGALLSIPEITCKVTAADWVPSLSWKKFARDRGATGPFNEIKGMKALRECTYGEVYDFDSEDIADSVLIYKTWKLRREQPKVKKKKKYKRAKF